MTGPGASARSESPGRQRVRERARRAPCARPGRFSARWASTGVTVRLPAGHGVFQSGRAATLRLSPGRPGATDSEVAAAVLSESGSFTGAPRRVTVPAVTRHAGAAEQGLPGVSPVSLPVSGRLLESGVTVSLVTRITSHGRGPARPSHGHWHRGSDGRRAAARRAGGYRRDPATRRGDSDHPSTPRPDHWVMCHCLARSVPAAWPGVPPGHWQPVSLARAS
jgi:hypothetical protein